MKDIFQQNWEHALTEVLASVFGTLGFVLLIAIIASLQSDNLNTPTAFFGYFLGGQIGLPILALSGIIFIAIRQHGRIRRLWSLILYIFFLGPIMATAFIVGLNPGFKPDVLSSSNLSLLWIFYFVLHFLWFLILVFEPKIPTAQAAADAQEDRVRAIKAGAVPRA